MKVLTADEKHPTFELEILRRLSLHQENAGSKHILHLQDEFRHTGPHGQHMCLVFQAMGLDMSAYRRLFEKRRLPAPVAKEVARQVLAALACLHEVHSVIHCGLYMHFARHRVPTDRCCADIKPQNILIDTTQINDIFRLAPSSIFAPDATPQPPDDFYIESVQLTSGEEDVTDPVNVNIRLADFGTCKEM